MKEVIEQLLEGNFSYDNGSLDFSCSKIEISLHEGEDAEGSFSIYGLEGRVTEGTVYTNEARMECLSPSFLGKKEEIAYCFHGQGLRGGDVLKGEFVVISNQGEYYLPFVVTVEYEQLDSSLGNIKNLFHFANLAKTSPKEAIDLFYSSEFIRILNGNDRRYLEIYKGLSRNYGNPWNVEEFLLCINKKQKVEYLVTENEVKLDASQDLTAYELNITRNGWGNTRLFIEVTGEFLTCEKEVLNNDDFQGNLCRLSFQVDNRLLHAGVNHGSIHLYNAYDSIMIPVMIRNKVSGTLGRTYLERKHLTIQLMEFYQVFRMKKISTATWLKETEKLVERMSTIQDKDLSFKLFQAQLLITAARFNEAEWLLDHAVALLEKEHEEDPVLWAYYLYLTTLIHTEVDYVRQTKEEIERIYKRNKDEWRLAWLLLYLSEEYQHSLFKKWMFLEEQFLRGCKSPIIYLEALQILRTNPSILNRLDEFEMQILLYAVKKEYLTEEIIMQTEYLASKVRDFSNNLYRILVACYQFKPDNAGLQEICSLLIRGGKTGTEYFKWYSRGIEQELRITRLYEYYMMSIDRNYKDTLPKMVLMYFSYQSNLQADLSAFLYCNVLRHKEGFPEIYEKYRKTIEQFVMDQILKLHISRDLAFLYKNVLVPRMMTPKLAECLAALMFLNQIETDVVNIRHVIVRIPHVKEEYVYPMTDGHAFVAMPIGECTVLLEDGNHNRYATSIPHSTEKLLLPGKMTALVADYVTNVMEFNLYMCLNGTDYLEVSEHNVTHFETLLSCDLLEENSRQKISLKLLQYYFENDMIRELDQLLEKVEYANYELDKKNEIFKYLITREKSEKAWEWLKKGDVRGIEPKHLVRLCDERIVSDSGVEDSFLTYVCAYAFEHGKYNERVLNYLLLYYQGMAKELRNLWVAARDFSVDTYQLCERILIQMMYTGSFVGEKMNIFSDYLSGGANVQVEIAFLMQCCFDYYVKDRVTEKIIFEEVSRLIHQGEKLHMICKLGFLKYYSENPTELTASRKETARLCLKEFFIDGIILNMFGAYLDLDICCLQMIDRTVVEYKGHPRSKVMIHYVIEQDEGEISEYMTEEMHPLVGGVCYKEFVLFFGERLQYYIVEQREGEEQLTISATLQKSDISAAVMENRYIMVNDISIGETLKDYDTVDTLMKEYLYKDYVQQNLFTLDP